MDKLTIEDLAKNLAEAPRCQECRRFHRVGPCPPRMDFVDYFSLMVAPSKTPLTVEGMTELTNRIKALAKECNVTILTPESHT